MIFLSLLACPHNSHANPPDGDVLIGPGEPFAFWAVERALFPGESVRFTVAVADGGFANGKSFVLDGEPTVQSIGPNTLWMPKDVDPYSIGFEAMNNGGDPLQETIEVYATWKEQLDPPAGGGKGAPAEPEMIDGVGSGFAYTDRPVFLFTYPGTRMQFADGETKIDFSVTAAANGAALDMNVYDIKGETAWDITENPAGVNTIVGSVKSGDEGEGNLKITHGGKTQGTSTKEIAFTDFDIAISAFGTEPDLKEDRKPEGGNGQPPHEMEPGGVVLVPVAVTGQLPTQGKRAKLSLSGHSAGGGTYTLKTSGSDKVKIYPNEIPTEGENPLPGEKTWPASDFSSDMTFYVGSESFAPVDNSSEATLTFTHKRALGGDPADAELKDETKVVLVNIQLEPDAGMVGIVGDTVPSVNPRSKIAHFVSPKKTAQIPADDVILKISGLDAKYVSPGNASQILEWDSAVGYPTPGEPTKRKVIRSMPGRYAVKIKTKSGGVVISEKIVWIIWTDATTTIGTTDFKIVTTGDLTGSSYTS